MAVDSPIGQTQVMPVRCAPRDGNAAPKPLARLLSGQWMASMRMRTSPGARLDLRYGLRLRNRLDYFPARHPGPVLVLLASSYDEPASKDEFAFAAAGLLSHGIHVAVVDTSQAPGQTLAGMSAESQAAVRWIGQRAQRFGGDVRRLLICGWGAGAPAAALCLDLPGVLGGLVISGVYDLAALRRDAAAAAWCLDGHDVLAFSPRRLGPSPRPLVLAYGSEDPSLIQDEAHRFAAWRAGMPGGALAVAHADRHALLLSLANPSSTLVAHICALFATGGASPVHAGRTRGP